MFKKAVNLLNFVDKYVNGNAQKRLSVNQRSFRLIVREIERHRLGRWETDADLSTRKQADIKLENAFFELETLHADQFLNGKQSC